MARPQQIAQKRRQTLAQPPVVAAHFVCVCDGLLELQHLLASMPISVVVCLCLPPQVIRA